MKHRADAVPPAALTTFDGRGLASEAQWLEAFGRWCDAREVWEAAHPGVDLPESVLGSCPEEFEFPHGGLWSRPQPDDGRGVRCREHDLRPDEH